jgi:hypothetical protein
MLKRGANKCGINLWATTAVLDKWSLIKKPL